MNINGIINIYKEKGYTSFDVVAILRGVLGMKKIGHTGTLDPDARGVLPVCLGKGTKVVELLTDSKKTYKAVFETGYITDTQDISGSVIERFDGTLDLEEVEKGLLSFVGDYAQVPPMYSALKHNGKKLYELAREGITIERKARQVHIFDISEIHQIDESHFAFSVTCSKGTYIRTLIYDLGMKSGVGATMTDLERTMVEPYKKESALLLDDVRRLVAEGKIMDYIQALDSLFDSYDELVVSTDYEKALYNGNKLPLALAGGKVEVNQRFRVYDSHKQFIGIYKAIDRENEIILKVEKMFY